MSRSIAAAAVLLSASFLAACAAEPATKSVLPNEPVAHEYRTGSILAQKEKRPVTDEERRRAQEIAAEIRAAPTTIQARP